MTIESKYNIHDKVFTIYKDEIVKYEIVGATVRKGIICYELMIENKGMKTDATFFMTQELCFSSIDELCNYYKKLCHNI